MPVIRIGANIDSLKAQRNLANATDAYSQNMQRLSSGLRINRPSDDAAGFAVSSSLNLQTRVSGQAVRNINDGISLYNIADTALNSLLGIANRQLELATQASNGSYTLTQRRSLDAEAESLRQEFNRIVNSTEFNHMNLLDRSLVSGLSIQAGMGTSAAITGRIGQELSRVTGTGGFGASSGYSMGVGMSGPRTVLTADFNNDTIADIITSNAGNGTFSVRLGLGNGGFGASQNTAMAGISEIAVADFDGDGYQDIAASIYNGGLGTTVTVMRGQGTGTFTGSTSYAVGTGPISVIFADFNGDSRPDIAAGNYGSGTTSVLLNNGSGGFNPQITSTSGTSIQIAAGDFNGDGRTDLASVEGNNTVSILLGNGTGTFTPRATYANGTTSVSVAVRDINYDGVPDVVTGNYGGGTISVLLGNSNGTLQAATTINSGMGTRTVKLQDLDGDGLLDLANSNENTNTIDVYIGRGDGTFGSASSYSTGTGPFGIAFADFNRDGAVDIVNSNFDGASGTSVGVMLATTRSLTTIGRLTLLTAADAATSMATITSTKNRVAAELGVVGAMGSRLLHAYTAADIERQNFAAASSRITDADIAEETAEMVKNKILQESAAAVLAQANQSPKIVLSLLEGAVD